MSYRYGVVMQRKLQARLQIERRASFAANSLICTTEKHPEIRPMTYIKQSIHAGAPLRCDMPESDRSQEKENLSQSVRKTGDTLTFTLRKPTKILGSIFVYGM